MVQGPSVTGQFERQEAAASAPATLSSGARPERQRRAHQPFNVELDDSDELGVALMQGAANLVMSSWRRVWALEIECTLA